MSENYGEAKKYNINFLEDNPYCRFDKNELILRDHLAIDRTILANERTLLAYIKTALAFLVGGVTAIKFFDSPLMEILGWALISTSIFTTILGSSRYKSMANRIKKIGCAFTDQDNDKL